MIKRHGDMVFFKVDNLEDIKNLQSKERDNLTVGLGEVSGHAHNIKPFEGGAIMEFAENFDNEDSQDFITRDNTYFEVQGEGAVIHHEDHEPIVFEPGVYVRVIQETYDQHEGVIRRVID